MTRESVEYLESRTGLRPKIGVVLGSGLGAFATQLGHATEISYRDIPNFPHSTAEGHAGQLVIGDLAGVAVAVMSGRFHLYEGYTAAEAAYGVRVLGQFGIRTLILTNAAGAINPDFHPGDLVLISDHLNLQGANPLTGPNEEECGPRFPDMTEAYSGRLRALAREVAAELGLRLPEGVYAALSGPSYETPAEIRFLRTIGADLVGMSTVPETIVANHMGLEVLAFSSVTNMAAGMIGKKLNHEDVLDAGRTIAERLMRLLTTLVPRLL